MSSQQLSIVSDVGKNVSKCGYSHREDASFTHGIWAYSLTCADYQDLIDRNWRRSGQYLYKPDPSKSYVIQYTIRLDCNNFVPGKKHRQLVRKVERFLTGQVDIKLIDEKVRKCLGERIPTDYNNNNNGAKLYKENNGIYSYDLGKFLTKEEVFKVHQDLGVKECRLDKKDNTIVFGEKHRLDIDIVDSKFTEESFKLFQKYQKNVHQDDDKSQQGYTRFLVKSPLIPLSPTEEILSKKESSSIFIKDCELLHTWKNFPGFGSFHVHYRLDGQLFMVGVIDLLPKCLSSVYAYYDDDFNFLEPGKYSALAEILFVKQYATNVFHYYYMGYYIHNIEKMKYKAQYEPSDLLCPTTFTWHPLSQVIKLVEADVAITDDPKKRLLNFKTKTKDVVINNNNNNNNGDDANFQPEFIRVWFNGKLTSLKTLMQARLLKSKETIDSLREYAKMVGKSLASNMAVVIE